MRRGLPSLRLVVAGLVIPGCLLTLEPGTLSPDAAPTDTGSDDRPDQGPPDTGSDTGFDTGFDTGLDTGFDTGFDTGSDTGADVRRDIVVDSSADAPRDVPAEPDVAVHVDGGPADTGCTGVCASGDIMSCTTGRPGACAAGTMRCVGCSWSMCIGVTAPLPERCNGVDDDCDGNIDQGLTGAGSTLACTAGAMVSCCLPSGTNGTCGCDPGGRVCVPPGGACRMDTQCCGGVMGRCQSPGRCCADRGGPCLANSDCCGTDLRCSPGSMGSNHCCAPSGGACVTSSDCCAGTCASSRCAP
jgi:hypothetical protein